MSNNSDTIVKLSEALNTLIGAYEKLQDENSGLKSKIKSLEEEKEDLELKLDEYENTTEKQNTNINSMLGKIESLLGNAKKEDTNTPSNSFFGTSEVIEESEEVEIEIKEESASSSSENKIDLDRMASLLNGFGNR